MLTQRICQRLPLIVAYRLSKFFLARERRTEREGFVVPTLTGSRYAHRTGDLVGDSVRMCGFWDWRNLAVAKVVAGRGAHVIEIGANTGTETLGFADIVGPTGRVTAFEPEPDNLRALRANIDRNGLDNVRVIAAAVSDRCGSLAFARSEADDNSGSGYLTSAPGREGVVLVQALTLDGLEAEVGPAALISMDVEGAELAALRGADHYLRRHRPVMFLEANGTALLRAGTSLDELYRHVQALGYAVFEVGRFRLRTVTATGWPDSSGYIKNWVALPPHALALRANIDAAFRACALRPRVPGLHPLAGCRAVTSQ